MPSKATTVKEYLAELPEDRRKSIEAIRKIIKANLDKGYEEGIQYGMIGYYVPHKIYPDGYHCDPKQPLPFAGIGNQKNHIGIYLMCVYGDEKHHEWFQKAWVDSGKKLDMGKACVRVKSFDGVAADVLGEAIRRVPTDKYIEHYEANVKSGGKHKASPSKKPSKPAAKKVSKKAGKKAAAKKLPLKKKIQKKKLEKKSASRKAKR